MFFFFFFFEDVYYIPSSIKEIGVTLFHVKHTQLRKTKTKTKP